MKNALMAMALLSIASIHANPDGYRLYTCPETGAIVLTCQENDVPAAPISLNQKIKRLMIVAKNTNNPTTKATLITTIRQLRAQQAQELPRLPQPEQDPALPATPRSPYVDNDIIPGPEMLAEPAPAPEAQPLPEPALARQSPSSQAHPSPESVQVPQPHPLPAPALARQSPISQAQPSPEPASYARAPYHVRQATARAARPRNAFAAPTEPESAQGCFCSIL